MNEIIAALRTAIVAGQPANFFAKVVQGKVAVPAASDLPMLSIYPIATEESRSGTVRDKASYRIGVEVILAVKQYFRTAGSSQTSIEALEALVDVIEERSTDGKADADTVIGILNANITAGGKALFTDNISVSYEQYSTPGAFPYAKATVLFTAHDRPSRLAS